jgi:hypothetical protein
MDRTLRWRLTVSALVLALGGLLVPAAAEAKVTCEGGGIPGAPVALPGLPAEPEADRLYQLTLDLPDAHAVNPRPILMAVRCEPLDPRAGTYGPDGSDSALFRGTTAGAGGSRFDVRFRGPGRWRLASMDVSGHFRDHGFYAVQPASSPTTGNDGATLALILVGAGGVAVLTAVAIGLGRRRHRAVASAPYAGRRS